MGCVCSCFHVPDPEENLNTSSSGSFCCLCGFFHTVINKYKSLYSNNQIRNLPLRDERPVSLTSIVPSDIPQSQTTTSVPRTLSFNVNSSHSNLQQDSLVTINERGAAPLHLNRHSHSQQLRSSDHTTQKLVNSSLKLSFNKTKPGYVHESFEDEDACPTCLEGKTS
ncbi:hypothetical protein Pint_23463 [Pistacia integerrima]|uniref:Uncharacterized protein n=1 Tax=Pistacia integerrima TaxID=434235 RepID=A0ACC0YGW4_9ROSI|nr:hypothetical protein Pint_23463 [Pistacia integerrima]